VFEYVYLARPDTTIAGRGVYEARVEMGRRLAAEYPVEADLVIPTPESGTPAAIGYAQASGIPFGQGLVKNSYVGRTFIQPSQTIRQRGIKLKLNPLKEIIRGKRLIVVDDSIVRGNTQRALVSMLREAGAAEVHVRISSPPITWPCFYGIDFATRAELIATGLSVDEIRQAIGADSLGFVSEEGMIAATEQPRELLCTACFTGKYPIPLPDAHHLGKNLLERTLFDDSFIEDGARGGADSDGRQEPVAVDASATPDLVTALESSGAASGGCDPGPEAEFETFIEGSATSARSSVSAGLEPGLSFGDPGRQE
jgi:amidophosphoribosyltransferase